MRTRGTFAAVQGMPTVRSAVRVRPCSGPARRRTCLVRGQAGSYVVDVALGDTCSQHQVYQHLTAPLVDSFIHGESAVLLVYGAAGTGKTHTLQVSSSKTTNRQDDTAYRDMSSSGVALSSIPSATHALTLLCNNKCH
jgi:Cdc6-like AAA superfamily ATPase